MFQINQEGINQLQLIINEVPTKFGTQLIQVLNTYLKPVEKEAVELPTQPQEDDGDQSAG